MLDQLAKAIRDVRTKNVIVPLSWPFGLVVIALVALAWRSDANPVIVIALVAGFSVLLLAQIVAYGYFAKNDPQRLHSESHIENITRLTIRDQSPTAEGDRMIEVTSNPEVAKKKLHKEDAE